LPLGGSGSNGFANGDGFLPMPKDFSAAAVPLLGDLDFVVCNDSSSEAGNGAGGEGEGAGNVTTSGAFEVAVGVVNAAAGLGGLRGQKISTATTTTASAALAMT
jgi:hypothetical protein